ncbi:MAG TPA: superoxide dismutase family protein [Candidatus Limnocylindrales bacterium]|nr:superoxide dismutase family protein [Candidatus Limnocylindrales bacterium]
MVRTVRIAVAAGAVAVMLATAVGAAGSSAVHARASLVGTDGQPIGWARFVEDATGVVHVNVHVSGLTPGLHGIHLHAVGLCEPTTFGSAGGHHNPLGATHGLDSASGGHAGDLPNLTVNEAGVGRLVARTDRATLSAGATSVFDGNGSAIVIHAGPDDQVTDPTGNSGSRAACGVIEWD